MSFGGIQTKKKFTGLQSNTKASVLADREGVITGIEKAAIDPTTGEALDPAKSLNTSTFTDKITTGERSDDVKFLNPFDFVEGTEITTTDLDDLQAKFPDAEINLYRETDPSFAPTNIKGEEELLRFNSPANIETDPEELFKSAKTVTSEEEDVLEEPVLETVEEIVDETDEEAEERKRKISRKGKGRKSTILTSSKGVTFDTDETLSVPSLLG